MEDPRFDRVGRSHKEDGFLMRDGHKKIFITGGTGLLGHNLIKNAPKAHEVSCTFFPDHKKALIPYDCAKYRLDITDQGAILEAVRKIRPDYVVHTASIANVDYVENNKAEAEKTNLGGTLNIIRACQETGAALIYISSNAVFDGENSPYSEDDPVNPLNYYGRLKVKEEALVRSSGLKYSIVRAILMYGWNLETERKNSVTWLTEALASGKTVNIVDDIFCNPLFVLDSCRLIWKLIELKREGTYHIGGGDEVSRYEFARMVTEVFGFDSKLIKPVKNAFFPGIATRPVNTTYRTDKIKNELGIFPMRLRDGLKIMKEERDGIA